MYQRWIEMPQGNINLLKKENVNAITEQIFNDDKVNIYDWFVSQTVNSKDNIKLQQLSLFDL